MKHLCLLLLLLFALAICGAAALADDGCADALGCVEIAPGEKIVFGGILRLSGPRPWSGQIAQEAFELAALARDGQLLGREIDFVLENSGCTEDGAAAAARRIIANPAIVGVIGTNCSVAAKGALPIISEAGYVMISPSSTSPFLTDADRAAGGLYQPGFFRTAHNDRFLGELSARFAASALNLDSIATIDDGDPYTTGLASAMADAFTRLNGELVYRGATSKGATDMSEIVSAIAQSGAELVYFPLFTEEAIHIAQQLAAAPGLEGIIMMSADSAFQTAFAQAVGEAGIGIYVTAPHVAGQAYAAFVETWREAVDEAGPTGGFHAHAFDAANLLFAAVEAVARQRDDGALLIGRGALREAVAATENFAGLTGSLTCRDQSPHAGDCATGEALAIFQLGAAEIHEGSWPPPVVWTAD